MASEKQIAANRENAKRSSGPSSAFGRKRASLNARLSLAAQVERRARKIAGDTGDLMILEYARNCADAELELARLRSARSALLEFVTASGSLDLPKRFKSAHDEYLWLTSKRLSSMSPGESEATPQETMPADPRRADCGSDPPLLACARKAPPLRTARSAPKRARTQGSVQEVGNPDVIGFLIGKSEKTTLNRPEFVKATSESHGFE